MLVSTYLVNLLCAVVECRGSMSPPEAYIAEYSTPSSIQIIGESLDPFNFTESPTFSNNYIERQQYRRKRLFPFLPSNTSAIITSSPGLQRDSGPRQLQSALKNFMNSIPNFFNSVSRVMQNGGNAVENSGITFRSGRKIGDNYNGRRNSYGDVLPVVYLTHGGGVEGFYMGTMNGRKIAAYVRKR